MPVKISPITKVLIRMKTIAAAGNVHERVGLEEPFKIRHLRNRKATKGEVPAMSLRLVTIELDPDRQAIHTSSEVCWKATVDMVLDIDLPPEEESDESDPTGWNILTVSANEFAGLYLDEFSDIRKLVDDVMPGDVDPDEDSTPDNGRLAQSVVVLYRTLWNDPNHLLSPEENGL